MSVRSQTIFKVPPYQQDMKQIQARLSDFFQEKIAKLLTQCKEKTGRLTTFQYYPYRIANVSYVNLNLTGERGTCTLTFVIAGYTEFPEKIHLRREYVYVVDATDCYWLISVLKHGLLEV
ncbi:hypothetical protein [Pasteurella oralis]|uniref:hypothetical protein n=1 Tax=Pasteurella oralis TaxID=1071947 RepID=UPI000C7B43F7|nr:hypothetical protein [Pasteurella oralis]